MATKSELWQAMARIVVSAILIINVASIGTSLYLFRYAIYCGLGVGVYSVLIYTPSLLLFVSTYLYRRGGLVAKARSVVLVLNLFYFALLLFEGTCFSCVDTCVENLQAHVKN